MESGFHISIEHAIMGSFVKYERLSKITYETYGGSSIASATELNIYIDLYSVLHPIFDEQGIVVINNYTDITSTIINMIGHYRTFFNKMNVKTKFFLVFSYNICDINRKLVAEYNEQFMKKLNVKKFFKISEDNLKLLNIICPYLPGVYFIKSERNYESSVIISHLIDKYGSNIPNLIISRDLYPIQLCTYHKYTSYLKPFKNKNEDLSYMISINEKPTFRYDFWKFVSEYLHVLMGNFYNISTLNFPLVMALNKFAPRSINKAIIRIPEAIKIVYDMVGENEVKILSSQLYSNDKIMNSKIPVSTVESRINALDIMFMRSYYDNDPESSNIKLIDLDDPVALNSINAKFFKNNPINLSLL